MKPKLFLTPLLSLGLLSCHQAPHEKARTQKVSSSVSKTKNSSKPSNPTIQLTGNKTLLWDSVPGATSYRVWKRSWNNGGPISSWVAIATTPSPSYVATVDWGLQIFRVTAVNAVGESAPSNQVNVAWNQ